MRNWNLYPKAPNTPKRWLRVDGKTGSQMFTFAITYVLDANLLSNYIAICERPVKYKQFTWEKDDNLSANTQKFPSARTEHSKRQNKALNLKISSDLEPMRNDLQAEYFSATSVSNGLFLIKPSRPIDSLTILPFQLLSWSVWMRIAAWFNEATTLLGRKVQTYNQQFLTDKLPSMELISSSQSTDPSPWLTAWSNPYKLTWVSPLGRESIQFSSPPSRKMFVNSEGYWPHK